jgi:L,D-transpeptidase ErfK/SrfK
MSAITSAARALALAAAAASCIVSAAASEFTLEADQVAVGRSGVHVVSKGDTLMDVARWNGLGYTQLMAANQSLDPWLPPAGTDVVWSDFYILPDVPRKGIVVNLAMQRLFYFPPEGGKVITYAIGVGDVGRSTPVGVTKVTRKQADPTWYPPPSIRKKDPTLPGAVGPGPDNPLGAHALYLGWPRYLIHGTNQPDAVGRTTTNGCLRLYPEDIEKLFSQIKVGTPVRVINQETAVAWLGEKLYVQIFPSKAQSFELETKRGFNPNPPKDLEARVKAAIKGRNATVNWEAVRQAGMERTGLPVMIAEAASSNGTFEESVALYSQPERLKRQ